MFFVILAVWLAAAAVVAWAVRQALSPRTPRWAGGAFIASLALAAIAAYLMTYQYEYSSSENTRVHGWPIPVVVFQRETPTSHWRDFLGPTIVLALPMNSIFYSFFPSVLLIFGSRRSHARSGSNEAGR